MKFRAFLPIYLGSLFANWMQIENNWPWTSFSHLFSIFLSFSFYFSLSPLCFILSERTSGVSPVIFMLWSMICHALQVCKIEPLVNKLPIEDIYEEWTKITGPLLANNEWQVSWAFAVKWVDMVMWCDWVYKSGSPTKWLSSQLGNLTKPSFALRRFLSSGGGRRPSQGVFPPASFFAGVFM